MHLGAFGILLGGHVFDVAPDRLLSPLAVTLASGAALVALELYQTARWLVLAKGVVIVVKLGLIACVPFFWEARAVILLAVVVLASLSSHMPARLRNQPVLFRTAPGVLP